jgi:hypothetical protein
MKKHTFRPFIAQFVVSLFCFIIAPIAMLVMGIELRVNNITVVLLAIAGYVFFFSIILLPGVYAIFDVLTKSYKTDKMVYIDSYIAKNFFFPRNSNVSADYRKFVGGSYHLKVLLSGAEGKSIFSMAFFHTMEKGKHYTVLYGEKSKTVLSVLSEQGEEMMQFDVGGVAQYRNFT